MFKRDDPDLVFWSIDFPDYSYGKIKIIHSPSGHSVNSECDFDKIKETEDRLLLELYNMVKEGL